MSNGQDLRGPWNEGVSPGLGEVWQYIDDPIAHVAATNGLSDQEIQGTERTESVVRKMDEELSKERSAEVTSATPMGEKQWSIYVQTSGLTPDDDSINTRTSKSPDAAISKAKSSAKKSK
jgi:Mn-containing catalase